QNSLNILDSAESQDHFGATLAVGNFNGDYNSTGAGTFAVDDLAIGVPDEDNSSGTVDTGAVHVIYGKADFGLHYNNNQLFQQGPTDAGDRRAETGDRYGFSLAAGNFNGDQRGAPDHFSRFDVDDLAIGIPFEDV